MKMRVSLTLYIKDGERGAREDGTGDFGGIGEGGRREVEGCGSGETEKRRAEND